MTTSPSAPAASKGQKKARDGLICQRLGLDIAGLRQARRRLTEAQTGLHGIAKARRVGLIARRLGISPAELPILSNGLANPDCPESSRVRNLLRVIENRPTVSFEDQQRSIKLREEVPQRSQTPRISPRGKWSSSSDLFVTNWGQVVHLYYDCRGARGFRENREPDPAVYRVEAKHPCCRGRRVCKICGESMRSLEVEHLAELLVSLHGRMLSEAEWEMQGWSRRLPDGPPYSGVSQRPTVAVRDSSLKELHRQRSTTPGIANPLPSQEAVVVRQPTLSAWDKATVGQRLTWSGFSGTVRSRSESTLTLEVSDQVRIVVRRAELERTA